MAIYALKAAQEKDWQNAIVRSLKENGQARFGWSYDENSDLYKLQGKINNHGWDSLTEDEKNCWQPFLFRIQPGDWIVYINTPCYGQCLAAKVSRKYYWEYHKDIEREWGYDANHCFDIIKESIVEFNRTDTHPYLRRRLSLQGRYYQIYAEKEFNDIISSVQNGKVLSQVNEDYLRDDFKNVILPKITDIIHRSHPGKDLENLIGEIFKKMPNVTSVILNGSGFRSDNGADLIVEYQNSLAGFFPHNQKLVVQVKSYAGDHYDDTAVSDMNNAIPYYDADCGIIITTGNRTKELENAVTKLSEDLKKPIALCAGEEVAALLMKYYSQSLI